MLTDPTAFVVFLLISCGFAAWFSRRNGIDTALASGMAVSMLAGTWFEMEILGRSINVSIATAAVWLTAYCVHSGRQIFSHLNIVDYLLGFTMVWHISVDTYFGGSALSVAAVAYGQWMLPYAVGRYAFLEPKSLQKTGPVFVVVCGMIGLGAVLEAVSGYNVWSQWICGVDDEVDLPVYTRFGLTRAHGPFRHPIFLGVILISMIPFAIEWMTRWGLPMAQRIIASICLLAVVAGILATVSRGPILCLPLIAAVVMTWRYRMFRWTLGGLSLVAVLFIAFSSGEVLKWLELGTNPNQGSRVVVLEESDEAVIYNGTRNRFLAPRIYGPIFLRGGLLGYGSEASAGFPPHNLPGIPTDPELLKRVSIIDNSYLNIGLAFGYVGLMVFIGMLIFAFFLDLSQVRTAGTFFAPTAEIYFVTRAATLIAVMVQIALVYWDYDHAFWVMAFVGATAGLASRKHRCLVGNV